MIIKSLNWKLVRVNYCFCLVISHGFYSILWDLVIEILICSFCVFFC